MTPKKFEDALNKLEMVVQKLEEGNLPLDDSLKLFEEGVGLVKFCSSKLNEIEKRVKVLTKDKGGNLVERDFPATESKESFTIETEGSLEPKTRSKKARPRKNKTQDNLL